MASEAAKELLQNHIRAQGVRRLKEIETGAKLSAINAQLIWTHGQNLPKERIQEVTGQIINDLFGADKQQPPQQQ